MQGKRELQKRIKESDKIGCKTLRKTDSYKIEKWGIKRKFRKVNLWKAYAIKEK